MKDKSATSRFFASSWRIAFLLMIGFFCGCSGRLDPDQAIARVNETNLQRLANLYLTYQMKNGWQGPADEAEFKQFIRSYSKKKLIRIGIDPETIDKLFISDRDGQPFKIRYAVAGSAMGSAEPVIFESLGTGGKRMVGFLNMEQHQVDEAEYENLWEGGTKPAPDRGDVPGERQGV